MSLIWELLIVFVAALWAGTMWRFVTEGWPAHEEQREFVWWYWPMFLLALFGLWRLFA